MHTRAEAFPLGLGVLAGKGVTAWQRTLASLAPAACAARILDLWLTSAVADRLEAVVVGLAGAAQDRLRADLPDTRCDRRADPKRPADGG
jgi:hypothetical protein